ncbi:MAG: hypothetical protein ABI653_06905 [Bacteroidota bacterium]
MYKVLYYTIDVDFEKIYGEDFSFLDKSIPASIMLAEGSRIIVKSVYNIK